MDRCWCCQRSDRSEPAEIQQHRATAAASSVRYQAGKKGLIPADAKWLWRFDSRTPLEQFRRDVQRKKFYSVLPHRIDNEIEKIAKIIDLELERQKRRPNSSDDDEPEPPTAA